MKLKVVRSSPEILLPTRGSDEAAGWDIYNPCFERWYGGEAIFVNTGLSVEIPKGYYLSIVLRSSLGRQGVIIPNAPAIIDSDYRGMISIILKNTKDPNKFPYNHIDIEKGQRIAQMILHKYEEIEFEEVEKLSESKRGSGGFGSTGK